VSEARRDEAVDAAARLLRHGDRSRAELERRLRERNVDEEAVREALDTLERVGVLDDARTASLRAANLAERGYGDLYIRAELERRSLPVEDAVTGLEPERERAARFVETKAVGARWLSRRGFDPEIVAAVAGAGSGALRYGS
jgi:SOS response regulatory protein OraA/RecX